MGPSSGTTVFLLPLNLNDACLDIVVTTLGAGYTGATMWKSSCGSAPTFSSSPLLDATPVLLSMAFKDLDADGDMDIVAGQPNGLHWYENLGVPSPTYQVSDAPAIVRRTHFHLRTHHRVVPP